MNPVDIYNPTGDSPWLLIAEHAGNYIPPEYNNLGLTTDQLNEHIAIDIGIYDLTIKLADRLNAKALLCNYSRLFVDCNRLLSAIDCIPEQSDGIVIPGNQSLSYEQKHARVEAAYRPFHRVVTDCIQKRLLKGNPLKIANIHSFTPKLAVEDKIRPWDVGVVYADPNPSHQLIESLQKTNFNVGDNQPYNGHIHRGHTVPYHCQGNLVDGVLIEVRQDHISDDAGTDLWAEVLENALQSIS